LLWPRRRNPGSGYAHRPRLRAVARSRRAKSWPTISWSSREIWSARRRGLIRLGGDVPLTTLFCTKESQRYSSSQGTHNSSDVEIQATQIAARPASACASEKLWLWKHWEYAKLEQIRGVIRWHCGLHPVTPSLAQTVQFFHNAR